MTYRRAPIQTIATLVLSLLTSVAGLGCATDAADEDPPREPTVGTPEQLPDSALAQVCSSTIAPSGLVCTSCGRGSQRTRECLPAQCTVTERGCLRCTDPKDRVAVDCKSDLGDGLAGTLGVGPADVFSFATCTINWGAPHISGTSCHFPGAESCVIEEDGDIHSLSCTHRDGSSNSMTSDKSLPLLDPLIGRPDDLPAPEACITTPDPGGFGTCTTCARDDLSATSSCHYPGLVDCRIDIFGTSGCLGRCTFEDGREVQMCNSTRGPRLVALPAP